MGVLKIYLIDYHIHPNYSIDAEDFSIDTYCNRAIEIGLSEICFTTHFECDPIRAHLDWFVRCKGKVVPINENWVETYIEEINNAKLKYHKSGLSIKAGLEIGYDLGLEQRIENIIKHPFDFIIGSVHCVDHVAISSGEESKEYLPDQKLEDIVEKYYHTLLEGVKTGFFDVIGHMDLYRRHGVTYFGNSVDKAYVGHIETVLKEMGSRNIGMEVNTSSVKHGHKEFYPSREILKLAKEAGIKIFTTGSDCHRISELGRGIKEATLLLKEMDLCVTTFDLRSPKSINSSRNRSLLK